MIFFLAGFATNAITNALLFYELARSPEIQERLCNEIVNTRNELNGNELTFDAMKQMKYLDMVITETLQLWPILVGLDRDVSKPFIIENGDEHRLALEPGTPVWLPIMGMHRDEKYFKDPLKFDSGRFSVERKHEITVFAPFGLGPRACIASRFALALKVVTFHLMEKYFSNW